MKVTHRGSEKYSYFACILRVDYNFKWGYALGSYKGTYKRILFLLCKIKIIKDKKAA